MAVGAGALAQGKLSSFRAMWLQVGTDDLSSGMVVKIGAGAACSMGDAWRRKPTVWVIRADGSDRIL